MRSSPATVASGRCVTTLLLLVAATTCLQPLAAAGAEPIAHWTLDEPAGEVAHDSSAGGRHGEAHGTTVVYGILDRARRFDGQDDFLALGDMGEFPAVTIAFWVQAADLATVDDWQGLVTSDAWETGVLHIPIRDGMIDVYLHLGDNRRGHVSSPRLKQDVWYHVAVVADTIRRTLRLYVNGSEQDLADLPQPPPAIKLLRQVIGREFDGRQPARYFRGEIDDVRIYDSALGAEDIRALCPQAVPLAGRDPRNIRTGCVIPDEGYCDQPYVVVTRDGNWLCTLTTAGGSEGANDSHVVATISADQGRTWSEPVDIEPADGPDAVYIMPLVTPGGRVYGFYNYNGDNFRCPTRSDCVGWFVFKYSDDHGRTWSAQRYRLPMRMTEVDRTNTFGGRIQMFWGIGKPITVGNSAILAFTKCGKYVIERGEGWFYRSDKSLLEGLWTQGELKRASEKGRILDVAADQFQSDEIALPKALDATQGGGLSLDCWIVLADLSPGQVLLDSRDESGRGLALTTGEKGVLRIEASDAQTRAAWESDPGLLTAGRRHHVVVTLDAGPKIIMFLVDGQLCDGGSTRQFGWGRYDADLGDVSGTGKYRMAASVRHFRLYDRPLRTSEAVSNYHAGPD